MQFTWARPYFIMVFLILAFGLNGRAQETSQVWASILDGRPQLADTTLDRAAYVTEKVQRLAHPEIVYVNWKALGEILKTMGIANPPTELTPELTKTILNHIGYAKRVEGENLADFVEEFREVYSIRYGGRWINYNFGSGRNGASGLVDIKGIGRTSLVRPWADGGHSSGIAGLPEAIKEALWSNILHEELPFGANRVLFILTTGTPATPSDPNSDARALIVREDSNRPAYFQQNDGVRSDMMSDELREMQTAADVLRMQKVLPRLTENLPRSKTTQKNDSEIKKLRDGFIELIDRAAYQYATAYTRQIILAGISTSNIEISGRAIDYGVTSALIGFPRATFSDSESPHGTTDSLKSDLFFELAEDYRDALPLELKAAIPSHEEIASRIDSQFRFRKLQGFLELAGTPKEFSEKLAAVPAGQAFAETILKIVEAGNEQIHQHANGRLVGRTGTYNLERILNVLISQDGDSEELANALSAKKLRDELVLGFLKARTETEKMAARESISALNLRFYRGFAVQALNRSKYQLRDRPALWTEIRKTAKMQAAGEDSLTLQKWMDQVTERNTHAFRGGEFQIEVLDTQGEKSLGVSKHIVFDLKTGLTKSVSKTFSGYAKELFCRNLFK